MRTNWNMDSYINYLMVKIMSEMDPWHTVNTLRPGQNGRHLTDDIFTCIFINENCCILIKFSLKYVHKDLIDNNAALVQIMAWRQSGNKPLPEQMMIKLLTHIWVTWPQWVNQAKFITTLLFQFVPNSQLLVIAYQDQDHIKHSSWNK